MYVNKTRNQGELGESWVYWSLTAVRSGPMSRLGGREAGWRRLHPRLACLLLAVQVPSWSSVSPLQNGLMLVNPSCCVDSKRRPLDRHEGSGILYPNKAGGTPGSKNLYRSITAWKEPCSMTKSGPEPQNRHPLLFE